MPPRLPMPLTRLNPVYPGQLGVPGTDEDTGLRMHPTGKVLYVDPNYPGASDARDGTNPTAPMLTVAAALALCRDWHGDVIMVSTNSMWLYGEGGQGLATATYTAAISEEITVNVNGVRIVGAGRGPTGVMWNPIQNAGTCITVSALDVIIEGFSFDQGVYAACDAIYAEWDGGTLFGDNLTVRHCYFTNTVATAIEMEFGWSGVIHDCIFDNNVYGIMSDTGGSGSAYNRIFSNWFFAGSAVTTGAISLLGGGDDNLIYGNWVYNQDAENAALATDEGINLTGGARNMVANNWLSCALPVAANGDYADLNSGSASDAWINNHCLNGDATTTP